MLPILIPTTRTGTAAALALTMEGLEVTEVAMSDRLHYARTFTEQWQSGRGFILVEHDVVPWPGALRQLDACAEELCAFEYPSSAIVDEPRSGWTVSLGCTKFSSALLERVPYDVGWQNRGWDELDGAVFATLQGKATMHLHSPPVAHAKARTLVIRQDWIPR